MKINTKPQKLSRELGFTLLELLVVIAVIGVLASLAVPRFQNHIKKAKFVEVINAASPYKTAVELCVQRGIALTGCDSGSNGIPEASTSASSSGVLASIAVADGVVTTTGGDVVDGATYILTPVLSASTSSSGLDWRLTGSTCLTSGLCEPIRQMVSSVPKS